jgi:histidinol phosphatase-like PHP family hydrolase
MPGYDFHVHSVYSDGELIPAEIARRYSVMGYTAVAITDHADNSNLEFIMGNLVKACDELSEASHMEVIPGVEFTHVPLTMLEGLVKKAKKLGARLVLVHGETMVEPVIPGTNMAAVKNPDVDILAHPGLISVKEAELARENDVFLELTTRKGHSLSNGHVAKIALETKAKLILNTDLHSPEELLDPVDSLRFVMGAGLGKKDSKIVASVNPRTLLSSI